MSDGSAAPGRTKLCFTDGRLDIVAAILTSEGILCELTPIPFDGKYSLYVEAHY